MSIILEDRKWINIKRHIMVQVESYKGREKD